MVHPLSLPPAADSLQPAGSPQIVLFDAVGTLIEARPPVADVYLDAGRRYGSRRSLEDIRQRFRRSFSRHSRPGKTNEAFERQRWQAIVGDVFDDVRQGHDRLFAELWEHFARSQSWRVFDDVSSVWTALEERGLRLGVASNFDERLVSVCRGLEPLDRARFVFCSSQLGYAKPCREFFRAIEDAVQAVGQEILLVGDDFEADLSGARQSGWQALHVDRTAQDSKPPALHSLHGLLDLLPA